MVAVAIFPTTDLLRELTNFEELFGFYDSGLRGVVKDAILLVDNRRVWSAHDMLPVLKEKVLHRYGDSPDAMMAYLLENTSADAYIEVVLEKIWDRITLMLCDFFQHHSVILVADPKNCWLGDDLMTSVCFVNENDSNDL